MRFVFLILVTSVFYKLSFYGFLHQINHKYFKPIMLGTAWSISKNTFSISKHLKSIKIKFLKTRFPSRNNIIQGYTIENSDINPYSVVVNESSPNINSELVTSSNVGNHYYIMEHISPNSSQLTSLLDSNNLKPNIVRSRSESSIIGNNSNLNQMNNLFASEQSINLEHPNNDSFPLLIHPIIRPAISYSANNSIGSSNSHSAFPVILKLSFERFFNLSQRSNLPQTHSNAGSSGFLESMSYLSGSLSD